MIQQIKKFTALPFEEKWLFLEAYYTLGKMRAAILLISFKRLTRTLEHKQYQEETPALDEAQMRTALRTGRAIVRAASRTPWESACLVQSLTA